MEKLIKYVKYYNFSPDYQLTMSLPTSVLEADDLNKFIDVVSLFIVL